MSDSGAVAIRVAGLQDLDDLVRVINASFEVERFFIDRDRTDREALERMFATGAFLVGEDRSGEMVAAAYIEQRGDHGYFGLLAVAPERKRQGIGRRMIRAIEDRFRALGCTALDLRVVNLRTELPPLYERMGFEVTGTEPFNDPRAHAPCHFICMSKPL